MKSMSRLQFLQRVMRPARGATRLPAREAKASLVPAPEVTWTWTDEQMERVRRERSEWVVALILGAGLLTVATVALIAAQVYYHTHQ